MGQRSTKDNVEYDYPSLFVNGENHSTSMESEQRTNHVKRPMWEQMNPFHRNRSPGRKKKPRTQGLTNQQQKKSGNEKRGYRDRLGYKGGYMDARGYKRDYMDRLLFNQGSKDVKRGLLDLLWNRTGFRPDSHKRGSVLDLLMSRTRARLNGNADGKPIDWSQLNLRKRFETDDEKDEKYGLNDRIYGPGLYALYALGKRSGLVFEPGFEKGNDRHNYDGYSGRWWQEMQRRRGSLRGMHLVFGKGPGSLYGLHYYG